MLDEPVEARFARLRVLSAQSGSATVVSLGEWKVVADPAWQSPDTPFNLADPGDRRPHRRYPAPGRLQPVPPGAADAGRRLPNGGQRAGHAGVVDRRVPQRPRGPDHRAGLARSAGERSGNAVRRDPGRGFHRQPGRAVGIARRVPDRARRERRSHDRLRRAGLGPLRAHHRHRIATGGRRGGNAGGGYRRYLGIAGPGQHLRGAGGGRVPLDSRRVGHLPVRRDLRAAGRAAADRAGRRCRQRRGVRDRAGAGQRPYRYGRRRGRRGLVHDRDAAGRRHPERDARRLSRRWA